MSPDTPQDDHLAELRRRWEADPGSRLYLQLAEEYRRAGRHGEALEVLRKGLEKYPHQVSALVSLGRVQLESGRPGEAAEALERAVSMDATNLVAMKLAVEAYLQQGDLEQARQRLELYKLLNEGDPEVEELAARLEGRPGAEPAQAPVPPPLEDVVAPPSDGSEPESASQDRATPPSGRGRAWSPTAAWPALPREAEESVEAVSETAAEAAGEVADGNAQRVSASPAAPVARHPEGDPFAELASPDLRRRYMSALGSEGIFPVPADEVEEVAAEEAPAEPMEALAEPAVACEWADSAVGEDDEDLAEVTAARADDGARPDEHPTVTLGQLYLDQGHPADAVRIFEAVLARDPDHVQARIGLLRARAASTASELPATRPATAGPEIAATTSPEPSPAPSPAPLPPTERSRGSEPFTLTAGELLRGVDADDPRRALLHAYLDRLRGPEAARQDRGLDVS